METPKIYLESHEEFGKKLKQCAGYLESIPFYTKDAFKDARYANNRKQMEKSLKTAIKAIESAKLAMHSLMMQDFSDSPDEKLLPIYLGRLKEDE